MARKIITTKNGNKYERVSRWITLQTKEVTKESRLYVYSGCMGEQSDKSTVVYFRYKGREYAIGQFLRLSYPEFFEDENGKESSIVGYDGENYWFPLLIEVSPDGDNSIRLYREVENK